MIDPKLTLEEAQHVRAFSASRPDWETIILAERICDEVGESSPRHKYGKAHPYITGMKFVLDYIKRLGPCSMLDIGSPLTQNVALACLPGVDVTVLDVRENDDAEMLGLAWKHATATALPYSDASWSIVTSLWVMGHVGDGRYGDPLRRDGDIEMIAEIARVLRPGGTAIIGAGLVDTHGGNIFNLHRIYTWKWLREQFWRVGLEVVQTVDLPVFDEVFIERKPNDKLEVVRKEGVYGLAVLRKSTTQAVGGDITTAAAP